MKMVWYWNKFKEPMGLWDWHNLLEENNNNLKITYHIAKNELALGEFQETEKFLYILSTFIYEMAEQGKKIDLGNIQKIIKLEFGGFKKFKVDRLSGITYGVKSILKRELNERDYKKVCECLNKAPQADI